MSLARHIYLTVKSCCYSHQLACRLHNGAISSNLLTVSSEVQSALSRGAPVVALETTILTHGMPYPHNVQTALEVEQIIQNKGVIPATIGVLNGQVIVGLSPGQLEELGTPSKSEKLKISRRDLAYALSKEVSGGTTVSGTMLCASKVGIKVFVTGGIGGVHRDGQNSLDVSTDLTELGRTPMAVVCAGIKSILDIGRTLEYLETQGVTVASYGEGREFPAFFTPSSGFHVAHSVADPAQAASLINRNLEFGVGSGMVIGVPCPSNQLGEHIEQAIQNSLQQAKSEGISGKDITPYILSKVNELTEGQSLQANIELIKHNASIGSEIALELANLQNQSTNTRRKSRNSRSVKTHPVVIGASILDCTAKVQSPVIKNEGTNPGTMVHTMGGVGRNIAETMARLDCTPLFISALGCDQHGEMIAHHLEHTGIPLSGVRREEPQPTANYCVLLDHAGEMYCGIGDMSITDTINVDWVSKFADSLREAPLVVIDGNIPLETLSFVLEHCSKHNVPVWFEPTCVDKATKLIKSGFRVTYTSPNLSELRAMHSAATGEPSETHSTGVGFDDKVAKCMSLAPAVLAHTDHLLVSVGALGVVAVSGDGYSHYPAASSHLLPVSVASVTGAGDSFVGAVCSGLVRGVPYGLCIKAGLRAAYLSLHSQLAVSSELCPDHLSTNHILDWAPWEPSQLNT